MLATAVTLAAVLPAAAVGDGEDFSQWRSIAAIRLEGNVPAGQLVEFELTDDAFAACRRDLGDLRITDLANNPVPHVVRPLQPDAEASLPPLHPARLLDANRQAGRSTTVTADFGAPLPKNRLRIVTAGESFLRRVRVEASRDGNSWRTLRRAGWLIQVRPLDGGYAKTGVDLPQGDHRYLRVTVYAGKGDLGEPTIESVEGRQRKPEPPHDYHEVPYAPNAFSVYAKERIAYIDVDLGAERLPLRRVDFPVTAGWHVRRVDVRGRDHETIIMQGPQGPEQVEEPWRSLGGGLVYRLDVNEADPESAPPTNLGIDLSDGCRYMRIIAIAPPGDPDRMAAEELGLPAFYRQRYFVAFQGEGPGPYKLYMGNDRAAKPNYDIEDRHAELRARGVATARMDFVATNPAHLAAGQAAPPEPSISEQYWGMIWPAVAVLGVLAIMMVRKQFRKARQAARTTREEDFHNL